MTASDKMIVIQERKNSMKIIFPFEAYSTLAVEYKHREERFCFALVWKSNK
jgi:hypothetical protein